jgi:basic amino acid/polyamine antiporter, APA family
MTSSLWRTKDPVALAAQAGGGHLRRVLSAFDLTLLGIGAVIGAGIFVLTGIAAATQAGPALAVSFVMAGLACAFAALVYAELASTVPVSGSAYTYAYVTMGEFVAWIIGWDLILEYALASGAVAIGWAGYFNAALEARGLGLPPALMASPFSGGIVNLPAAAVVLALSGLLAVGVRQTSLVNGIVVLIKLAVLGVFLVAALPHVEPANWQPFMPFGWGGVMGGAALIFFAYIGFDAVSTAAEEARNPQRDLPIGIIVSLALCTLLYIVVALVLTGIAPYHTLNVSDPVAHALMQAGERLAAATVSVGAIAGLTSVLLVLMYGQTRVFFAMSRDGLLPPAFSTVHPRFRTPARTVMVTGVAIAAVAGFMPIAAVAELVNVGTLAAFVVVSAGVLVLRRTRPDLPRPFRTPFMPWVPLAAIGSCLYLIASLSPVTLLRFLMWMALGVLIYFFYSRRNAILANAPARP